MSFLLSFRFLASLSVIILITGCGTGTRLSIQNQGGQVASLSYTTNSVSYVVGTSITTNRAIKANGTFTNFSVSPPLPTGLILNTSTGDISGTPTAASTRQTYRVSAIVGSQSIYADISIAVGTTVVAPSNLTYSNLSPTYLKGSAIQDNLPSNSGGMITSYSAFPALPAGLNLDTGTGVISGTPTTAISATSYTITGSNSAGSTQVALSITVNPGAPYNLTYAFPNASYGVGVAITNNSPSASGGTITSYSVASPLPSGITLDTATGIISGTPTAATASASYVITATNASGSTSTTLTIDVVSAPTQLLYSASQANYTLGDTIVNNQPSNSGGSIAVYTINKNLPAGLAFNTVTGIISGTPTAISAQADYIITGINAAGSISVTIQIAVRERLIPPANLSYSRTPAYYSVGAAIQPNTPSSTGGTITSYAINRSLPPGLSFNTATGVISGTPTSNSSDTYTITGSNTLGDTSVSLLITTLAAPSDLHYNVNPASYSLNSRVLNLVFYSGGAPSSYSVSPSLPAGLTLDTQTGTISGSPTALSATTIYTVTATNFAGGTTANLSITITSAPEAPRNLTYTDSNVLYYGLGKAITPNSPIVEGGTPTSYTVSPALPAGLALDSSTGILTGTPSAVFTTGDGFVITASNNVGSTTYRMVIVVPELPTPATFANSNVTYTVGTRIPDNALNTSGGAPNTYSSITPSLPAGLSLVVSSSGTSAYLTGTPTAAAAQTTYSVTITNVSGSTTANLQMKVLDPGAVGSIRYSNTNAVYKLGVPIVNNNPTTDGAPITSFAISPKLPQGLSLDTGTGIISGTPTVVASTATYTVTGIGSNGSQTTTTLSINVHFSCESSSVNSAITYVGSESGIYLACLAPGYQFSISPALPSGLSLNTSTGEISGILTYPFGGNFTVTAVDANGNQASTQININFLRDDLRYKLTPVFCNVGDFFNKSPGYRPSPPTVRLTGPYSVSPALPKGLTLMEDGTIRGNPTEATTDAVYRISASYNDKNIFSDIYLRVQNIAAAAAPTNLAYFQRSVVYPIGKSIAPNAPSYDGYLNSNRVQPTFSISPALPSGFSFNSQTGVIYGNPTSASNPRDYTITATTAGGSAKAVVNIGVYDKSTLNTYLIYGQKAYTPYSRSSNIIIQKVGGAISSFAPFGQNYQGEITVASGDVDGDGIPDIIAGSQDARVYVFSGKTGNLIRSYSLYFGTDSPRIAYVAAGDITGDGRAEVFYSEGPYYPYISSSEFPSGGPKLAYYGNASTRVTGIQPYGIRFSGNIRIAMGDLDGDGKQALLSIPGAGGGPQVKAQKFTYDGNYANYSETRNFFAYDSSLRTGFYIAAGDFNGDGKSEILTSTDVGATPHAKVFDGPSSQEIASFFAYDPSFMGGFRIAATAAYGAIDRMNFMTMAGPAGGPHAIIYANGSAVYNAMGFPNGLGTANPGFNLSSISTYGTLATPALPIAPGQ